MSDEFDDQVTCREQALSQDFGGEEGSDLGHSNQKRFQGCHPVKILKNVHLVHYIASVAQKSSISFFFSFFVFFFFSFLGIFVFFSFFFGGGGSAH